MRSIIIFALMLISGSMNAQNNSVKLLPPDEGYIYHGAFPYMGNTEDVVTKEKIELFDSLAGKKTAWVNFSNNWYTGIIFPSKEVELINSMGKIPYIRLMPRSDFNTYKKDTLYTLDNIINGKFDKKLSIWARAARDKNIPLMLDFAPEMNGSWFQWSGIHNGGRSMSYGDKSLEDGPEKYRIAYRHIIDIFRKEKALSITWLFHPNNVSDPEEKWNSMSAYYPGDDYIDWIGMSVYGSQRPGTYWYSFDEAMSKGYNALSLVSSVKPMAVLEFGVVDDPQSGNKGEWMVSALSAFINKRYPLIKAISYWQTEFTNSNGTFSDLKINSSDGSLNAYRNLIQSIIFIEKAKLGKVTE